MTLEILDPTHEGNTGNFAFASRLSALEGTTVGIISNGKRNTIPFFDGVSVDFVQEKVQKCFHIWKHHYQNKFLRC